MFARSDQSGSFQVQGSVDGTNYYNIGSSVAVTGGTTATLDQVVYSPFTRVVYTNGGTPQTVFAFSVSSYTY